MAGAVELLTERIIPARAGFTAAGGAAHKAATDHPRSRGVYRLVVQAARLEDGSSPLARGLLQANVLHRLRRRIIPARAGFTPRVRWRRLGVADHPRSRGVYEI